VDRTAEAKGADGTEPDPAGELSNRKVRIALIGVVAIAALAAGYLGRIWSEGRDPEAARLILGVTLDDLDGKGQPLSQWRGKVLVVNFWATWCPPCLEEIPAFVQLQSKYGAKGIQFVGIAVDDKPKVAEFSKRVGINYPILIGGLDAIELSRKSGNRLGGLPYTVIIDRNGNLANVESGKLTLAALEDRIKSLL